MNDEQFFRFCWLTLKRSKPRLRKYMDKIEYTIAGAGIIKDESKSPKEKSQEKPDDGKPEPVIV